MRERMWLRATCAAVAVLLAPGMAAAAEGLIGRSSGAFRVQTGITGAGDPEYTDCGRLNMYKVAGGGREWRLEDTCDQLIDVLVPTISPTPTPTPTGGTVTPTPTPKPSGSADCPDGNFSRISSTHYSLLNVTLQQGKAATYCVELPAKAFPFFEIYTINKGNSSCSDLEMTAISPSGHEYFTSGPAPVVRPNVEGGRWQIELFLNDGCSRYDFHVGY